MSNIESVAVRHAEIYLPDAHGLVECLPDLLPALIETSMVHTMARRYQRMTDEELLQRQAERKQLLSWQLLGLTYSEAMLLPDATDAMRYAIGKVLLPQAGLTVEPAVVSGEIWRGEDVRGRCALAEPSFAYIATQLLNHTPADVTQVRVFCEPEHGIPVALGNNFRAKSALALQPLQIGHIPAVTGAIVRFADEDAFEVLADRTIVDQGSSLQSVQVCALPADWRGHIVRQSAWAFGQQNALVFAYARAETVADFESRLPAIASMSMDRFRALAFGIGDLCGIALPDNTSYDHQLRQAVVQANS